MCSTSPSIYVRFPAVSASDACGIVGSAVTSITLAFAPGELSTFVWEDYEKTSSQTFTSALDTADLPCGPWNGTDKFLPEQFSNYSSYQPLIVLPSKLIDFEPAWKYCTADIFEGQDPPRTLSPAAAMVPAPTHADKHAQKNAASPIPSGPALPVETGLGNSKPADPDPDPTLKSPTKSINPSPGASGDPGDNNSPPKPVNPSAGGSGDPSDSHDPANNAVSPAASPAPDPTRASAGDPPAGGSPVTSLADNNDIKNDPPAFPSAVAFQDHTITQGAAPVTISKTPIVYQSGSISAGGQIQAVPTNWAQRDGNASPVIVGGLTFSAVPSAAKAGDDPQNDNNPTQQNDPAANTPGPATYITIGDQTIAVDPTAISVAGTTLKPGDPGITISGTPISLGSSVFVVGTRTEQLFPTQAPTIPHPPSITIGTQIIPLDSTALAIDGTTLYPAHPAITIDGTLISLGSSILVIGSHTQSLTLPQSTPPPAPSYLTFAGETIAVAASSIVIAGHTMTPGGPAVTADGKIVSFGSLVLVIGTQTMSLTLPTASADASCSDGIGALIMKGLGGIGGTVAPPTQTVVGYNGTGGGNGSVMLFTGDAKRDAVRLWGWVAGVLVVLVIVV